MALSDEENDAAKANSAKANAAKANPTEEVSIFFQNCNLLIDWSSYFSKTLGIT